MKLKKSLETVQTIAAATGALYSAVAYRIHTIVLHALTAALMQLETVHLLFSTPRLASKSFSWNFNHRFTTRIAYHMTGLGVLHPSLGY